MSADLLVRAHAAFRAGDHGAALQISERVLARDPGHAQALALKANAAMQLGDNDALISALQRLHALRPDDAAIRRNLATCLNRRANRALERNDFDAAEGDWRAALALVPWHREARFNLGGLYRRVGDGAAALALYQSLAAESDEPALRLAIADCLVLEGRADEARALFDGLDLPADLHAAGAAIAARCSAHALAVSLLPPLEAPPEQRVEAAAAVIRELVAHRVDSAGFLAAYAPPPQLGERSPELRVALYQALALPEVLDSAQEIEDVREGYRQRMESLVERFDRERLQRCERRIAQLASSTFLLAYHGRNDHPLQCRYGDWLDGAARILGADLPALAERRQPGRARVGLISANWYYCTVGSYFGSWIEALAELDVDLHVVHLGPREDDETNAFARRAPHFHRLGPDADAFAAAVRALDLDLAIYPELGMDQRLFAAAAAGLAHRQWMAWGHPVTCGLPSVSHYLTCGEMEPAGADAAYREQLLRLPGLGTRFALPPQPVRRTRDELGLPAGRLAVVPQSIFKVLPTNDSVYAELLDRDASARLMFFGGELNAEAQRFRRRLRQSVGTAAAKRLHFLPEVSRPRYLEILSACDLMMDTLGWSGGNSALDALRAGLPIVTHAGDFMRGRQCATMLQLLGVEGACAESTATLAELAAQRIADRDYATHFRSHVEKGLPDLVNDTACDRALRAHVESELARSQRIS